MSNQIRIRNIPAGRTAYGQFEGRTFLALEFTYGGLSAHEWVEPFGWLDASDDIPDSVWQALTAALRNNPVVVVGNVQ